ncbi:hypothetical protein niasHS_016668 [Heterodera schachtii]|uniref:Uncharacterized protein n=2 Tax=Heterodera TaxID=34509 RepID=A0ABD2HZ36_HETSC
MFHNWDKAGYFVQIGANSSDQQQMKQFTTGGGGGTEVPIRVNDDDWYQLRLWSTRTRGTAIELWHPETGYLLARHLLRSEHKLSQVLTTRICQQRGDNTAPFVGCLRAVALNGAELVSADDHQARAINVQPGCHRQQQCVPSSSLALFRDILSAQQQPCANGGVCVDPWDRFMCHCPRPFLPPRCAEQPPEATFGHGDQPPKCVYALSTEDKHVVAEKTQISFLFRTADHRHGPPSSPAPPGTMPLFYIGETFGTGAEPDTNTFIAAQLRNGVPQVNARLGGKQIYSIDAQERVDDGKVHLLEVNREGNLIKLKVDDGKWHSVRIARSFEHPLLADQLIVGTTPNLPTDAFGRATGNASSDHRQNLKGTLQDFRVNERLVPFFQHFDDEEQSAHLFGHKLSDQNLLQGTVSDDVCGVMAAQMPCGQHDTCVNIFNNFECHCAVGWMGLRCEQRGFCGNSLADNGTAPKTTALCPEGTECQNLDGAFVCASTASLFASSLLRYTIHQFKQNVKIANFTFEIRTRTLNGHLIKLQCSNHSLIVHLKNGALQLSNGIAASKIAYADQNSSQNIADGQWHKLVIRQIAKRGNDAITLSVDGTVLHLSKVISFSLAHFGMDKLARISVGRVPEQDGFKVNRDEFERNSEMLASRSTSKSSQEDLLDHTRPLDETSVYFRPQPSDNQQGRLHQILLLPRNVLLLLFLRRPMFFFVAASILYFPAFAMGEQPVDEHIELKSGGANIVDTNNGTDDQEKVHLQRFVLATLDPFMQNVVAEKDPEEYKNASEKVKKEMRVDPLCVKEPCNETTQTTEQQPTTETLTTEQQPTTETLTTEQQPTTQQQLTKKPPTKKPPTTESETPKTEAPFADAIKNAILGSIALSLFFYWFLDVPRARANESDGTEQNNRRRRDTWHERGHRRVATEPLYTDVEQMIEWTQLEKEEWEKRKKEQNALLAAEQQDDEPVLLVGGAAKRAGTAEIVIVPAALGIRQKFEPSKSSSIRASTSSSNTTVSSTQLGVIMSNSSDQSVDLDHPRGAVSEHRQNGSTTATTMAGSAGQNSDVDEALAAMNGQLLGNRRITCSYDFDGDTRGAWHGTTSERGLALPNPQLAQLQPHPHQYDAALDNLPTTSTQMVTQQLSQMFQQPPLSVSRFPVLPVAPMQMRQAGPRRPPQNVLSRPHPMLRQNNPSPQLPQPPTQIMTPQPPPPQPPTQTMTPQPPPPQPPTQTMTPQPPPPQPLTQTMTPQPPPPQPPTQTMTPQPPPPPTPLTSTMASSQPPNNP